jgi:hypothetical protein
MNEFNEFRTSIPQIFNSNSEYTVSAATAAAAAAVAEAAAAAAVRCKPPTQGQQHTSVM